MIPLIHGTINGLIFAAGSSLAASIVAKATIVATLGLLAASLARRSRAAVRHALLAAMFGVLLMLPLVSAVAPPLRIPVNIAARTRPVATLTAAPGAIPLTAPAHPSIGVAPVVPPVVTRPAGRQRGAALSLSTILLTGWIAGTVLFLLPVITGLWQVRRLRRSAAVWPPGISVIENLALDPGLRRRVDVLLSRELPGPMTCGVLHPAILLPEDAQTWPPDDLNRAIVHELEHVRRLDCLSHSVARVVCAAYWFHPLVWIAWRRFALEAERSCDDAVLGRSEAIAYADQLVALAQRLSLAAKGAAKAPLLAMANRADLSTRVDAVLDTQQRRGRAGKLSVALAYSAAAALVLTLSPLRMVAAPQSPSLDVAPIKAAPLLPTNTITQAASPQAPDRDLRVSPVRIAPTRLDPASPILMAAAPQPASPDATAPLLFPLTLAAEPQAAEPQAAAPSPPSAHFTADTILVILNVVVSDENGQSVDGLSAGDFVVSEDGALQHITIFEFQKLADPSPGTPDSRSNYYIVGYYTTIQKPAGVFRTIKVSGKGDATANLRYRARAGYFATSPNRAGTIAQPDAGRVDAGTSPPILLHKVEAEYSEAARKAKWQGTAHLDVVVDDHGIPIDLTMTRALGMGLDQKAMEAVWQWRFTPGTKDGKPVTTHAEVDVNFRLF